MEVLCNSINNCTNKTPAMVLPPLEGNDPVRLESFSSYDTLCHFPTREGKCVLALETIQDLIKASNAEDATSFHFGLISSERVCYSTSIAPNNLSRMYIRYLTSNQMVSRNEMHFVESVIPALFRMPVLKNYFTFKDPLLQQPELVKLQAKYKTIVLGKPKNILEFGFLSAGDSSVSVHIQTNPRELMKREIIFFLADYIKDISFKWKYHLKYDLVVNLCRFTFFVLDKVKNDKMYTLAQKSFSLVRKGSICFQKAIKVIATIAYFFLIVVVCIAIRVGIIYAAVVLKARLSGGDYPSIRDFIKAGKF